MTIISEHLHMHAIHTIHTDTHLSCSGAVTWIIIMVLRCCQHQRCQALRSAQKRPGAACREGEGEGEGVGVDQRLKESRDAVKLLRMWW